jgi:hypothetical protein
MRPNKKVRLNVVFSKESDQNIFWELVALKGKLRASTWVEFMDMLVSIAKRYCEENGQEI